MKFIHVGLQRCASTWLQFIFFRHHPNLRVVIPNKPNSRYLVEELWQDKINFSAQNWMIRFKDAVRTDYKVDISKLDGISNENLCGHIYTAKGHQLCIERISQIFGEVKILIFFRHPLTYIVSSYAFGIKWGDITLGLRQHLEKKDVRTGLKVKLDYASLLKRYQSVFGDENVLALPYELMLNDSSCLTQLLCDFIDVPNYSAHDQSHSKVNPSYSRYALKIIRNANKIDRVLSIKIAGRPHALNRKLRRALKRPTHRWIDEHLPHFQAIQLNMLPEDMIETLKSLNYDLWQGELEKYNYQLK